MKVAKETVDVGCDKEWTAKECKARYSSSVARMTVVVLEEGAEFQVVVGDEGSRRKLSAVGDPKERMNKVGWLVGGTRNE